MWRRTGEFSEWKDFQCPLVVSHPWWAIEHPDPEGQQLGWICSYWEKDVRDCEGDSHPNERSHNRPVFIDYCCLPQIGMIPIPANIPRTAEEETRFRDCLRNMHVPYTHDMTKVLRLDYTPPPGTMERILAKNFRKNDTAYEVRGWCFFERKVSEMKIFSTRSISAQESEASANKVVTLLHPDDFNTALEKKRFTSKKADPDVVRKLYKKVFSARTQVATRLKLETASKESFTSLWKALPAYKNLEELIIQESEFGDSEAENVLRVCPP